MSLPSYAQNVICTQEAEVYILDQKNYDRLIEKRNPQVIEILRAHVREKYNLRLSWISTKELPLIRYFLYKMDEQDRMKELKSNFKPVPEKDILNDWMNPDSSKRGPVIDMYGPGSVFYSIRMREKQRKLEKLHQNDPKNNRFEKPDIVVSPSTGGKQVKKLLQDSEREHSLAMQRNNQENYDPAKMLLVCDRERLNQLQSSVPVTPEIPREKFSDPESNDDTMKSLEARIAAWHTSLPANDMKGQTNRAVKLHRPDLEVCIICQDLLLYLNLYHQYYQKHEFELLVQIQGLRC